MRVGILTGEEHGTNYFRGTLLKRALDRRGVECFHTYLYEPSEFARCDVAYLLRPSAGTPDLLGQLHALKRRGVPLVVDADDQIFDVPAWSPAAAVFHRREVQRFYRGVYAAADVVTTPSAYLARAFRDIAPEARFHVVPNAFDRGVKLLKPLGRLEAWETPNVGWSGGSQHAQDLAALDPVWHRLLDEGVGLTFVGDVPRSVVGRERTRYLGGSQGVELYLQTMPLARFDVALAPLLDCEFNRCKSALKAVEYAHLCGCPMVLSDLPCYDEVESDDIYVFKVKTFDPHSWCEAIEAALTTMRTRGRRYHLDPRYDLDVAADLWVRAFEDAIAGVRGDPVEPITEAPRVAVAAST